MPTLIYLKFINIFNYKHINFLPTLLLYIIKYFNICKYYYPLYNFYTLSILWNFKLFFQLTLIEKKQKIYTRTLNTYITLP